ncbi:MAG: hypothetical protein WC444_04880 [Candidatus Paceibacterota bacterium]
MAGLRTKTLEKVNGFLKKAQKEEEPKDETEEAPEPEGGEEVEEESEGEEAGDEEVPAEGEEATEEEEAEEPEEKTVEEKVDDLTDKVDSLADAVNQLLGLEEKEHELEETEQGVEDDFSEYVEMVDDENAEELSEEEFGMSPDQFVTSSDKGKERGMTLRQKRLARMKIYKKSTTLADEFALDKSLKNKKDLTGTPVVNYTDKLVKVPPTPDMLKVAELSLESDDANTKWTVMDKRGRALYTIARGTINPKEFSDAEFARGVIRDMHKMGVKEALKKYGAKPWEDEEDKKDEDKKDEKEAKASLKQIASDYHRKFARAMRLVIAAMNKNMIRPIPLKGALIEIMAKMGVEQPITIIEAAFKSAADKHFEVALANAEKLMDMSDEAFVEYEALVHGGDVAPVASPEQEAEIVATANLSEKALDLRRQAAKGSVDVSSASEEDVDSFDQRLAAVVPKPLTWKLALRARK